MENIYENFSMAYPKQLPSSSVIIPIGKRLADSFAPMSIAEGASTKTDISRPFNHPFIGKFDIEIRKPEITHKRNAEASASQERPWRTIGITSIIPATAPNSVPTNTLFLPLIMPISI